MSAYPWPKHAKWPPPPPSVVRISGELALDARALLVTGGAWIVVMAIRVQGLEAPVQVVRQYGSGVPAQIAAASCANNLRRGARVTAHGTGLSRKRGYLELTGCDVVEHAAPQPSEAAA